MRRKSPVFSIILCTYNRANLIERAINSVLKQSFSSFELIIIDDGSTDTTQQKIRKLLQKNQRIQYFWQQNNGLIRAKIAGIKKARGNIITFLDSDDWYKKEHLRKNYMFFKKHPHIDMVLSNPEISGPSYALDMKDFSRKIHLNECAIYSTFFIRKHVFKKIGYLPDPPYGNDYYLHQLIIKTGFKTAKLNLRTYFYNRKSIDSMSLNFEKKSNLMHSKEFEKRVVI